MSSSQHLPSHIFHVHVPGSHVPLHPGRVVYKTLTYNRRITLPRVACVRAFPSHEIGSFGFLLFDNEAMIYP
jgi:hypothetical protein